MGKRPPASLEASTSRRTWGDVVRVLGGVASDGRHEDLHASTKTKDEMYGGLLLNVVVGQSTTILKMLACEDKTLLVRRNTLLVLNLSLHVFDGVR
jgi:hypothetical protein